MEHESSLAIAFVVCNPDAFGVDMPEFGRLFKAHRLEPQNYHLTEGLRVFRSCVDYSIAKDAESQFGPEFEWYPGCLFSPAIIFVGFFAWCVICASLTRWWQIRRRHWLIVAGVAVPLALIPPTNELVGHLRREHDRLAPPVTISKDTILRTSNGHDYPAKIQLPQCVECRKIGQRGDWLQVEFASGLVGWVLTADALVASDSHSTLGSKQ